MTFVGTSIKGTLKVEVSCASLMKARQEGKGSKRGLCSPGPLQTGTRSDFEVINKKQPLNVN